MVSVNGSDARCGRRRNPPCTAGNATTTDHMPTPPMVDIETATPRRSHAYGLSVRASMCVLSGLLEIDPLDHRQAAAGSGAGNPGPIPPRRGGPIRARPACATGGTPLSPPWRCRSRSCRRNRCGRARRPARSAPPAHASRRAVRAPPARRLPSLPAVSRAGQRARRPGQASPCSSVQSRTTMPRRNTCSAPGRRREARGDLAAGEGLHHRQRSLAAPVSAASTTPSSVWSSSARMKLPSRLRTSACTGSSLRPMSSACRCRAPSAWSRSADNARGSRA